MRESETDRHTAERDRQNTDSVLVFFTDYGISVSNRTRVGIWISIFYTEVIQYKRKQY